MRGAVPPLPNTPLPFHPFIETFDTSFIIEKKAYIQQGYPEKLLAAEMFAKCIVMHS
jgi:hypothetical protein